MSIFLENVGKKIRFSRIQNNSNDAIIAVPMDHGYTLGPINGLRFIRKSVHSVFKNGASCVIVHKGMVKKIAGIAPHNGIIIHLSGSTSFPKKSQGLRKVMTGTVEEALSLGADAVSCHINLGNDYEEEMLKELGGITNKAMKFGLPVLSMMYCRNNDGETDIDTSTLSHLARVAEESGCDIVKINMPKNTKNFEEISQGLDIPILVAGGKTKNDFSKFLEDIRNCILLGAKGVSVGRNIFSRENIGLAMEKINKTVAEAIDAR